MRHSITAQFVCDDFSGVPLTTVNQPLEESFSGLAISPFLEENIYDIAILVYCSPEIMLYSTNLNKYFINKKGITESLPFSL